MSASPSLFWRIGQMILALVASAFASSPNAHMDCFAAPSSCGYPDATNTGVPAPTSLAPSKSITITRDGETLDGRRIVGSVIVAADNVTIEDSRIIHPSGGSGSYAVILNRGADNFTISNSEIAGPSRRRGSRGLESAVWNHYDNPGATASRVYLHNCADCWEGSGTFRNSYMVVNAAYPESHDEDIYVCGGRVDIDHSTLVNMHHQTAVVFGDTSGCGANHIVLSDSLLAGGGFLIYPQANSDAPTGSMRITGNHFARCRTAPIYERGTGGTRCAGDGDLHGLFPKGGYYGVAAYYYLGDGNVWDGNVWDDNLHQVCPAGPCRGR